MLHRPMVATTGSDTGTTIANRMRYTLAPSITADSSRSGGMARKKLRMMMM